MKKREFLCSICWNINWCSQYGKQYGVENKNKIVLPYDPLIPIFKNTYKIIPILYDQLISIWNN